MISLHTVHSAAHRQARHKVVDDWLYNITDGLHTTVCSFDIRKCFDTIYHSILCKKMDKYGENDIDLFRSYLSNRKQIIKCHNEISQMCDIHIGVPQGSVLGPILFHLYILVLLVIYMQTIHLSIYLPIMLILYRNVPIILHPV